MEIWKDIPEYEGLYQVSNEGRFRSLDRKVKSDFMGRKRVSTFKGRILKLGMSSKGYAQIHPSKNGNMKTYECHRIVAKVFIPNPYNYPQVNHIDGDTMNCHPSNLEWCTASYNMIHANTIGLRESQKGSRNTQAILDEEKVVEIKRLHLKEKISQRKLGKIFGVSHTTIRKIILGTKWAHVNCPSI